MPTAISDLRTVSRRHLAVIAAIAALLGGLCGAAVVLLFESGEPGPAGPPGPAGAPVIADVGVLEARIHGLERRVRQLERALDGRAR